MEFDGKSLQLFGLWLKWICLTVITLGIYSLWIPISLLKWEKKHTNKKGISAKPYSAGKALIVPIIVVILIVALFAGGIYMYNINSSIILSSVSKEFRDKINDVEKDYNKEFANIGKNLIEVEPTKVQPFSENLAWIYGTEEDVTPKNERWMCVDTIGTVKIELNKEVNSVSDFYNGASIVRAQNARTSNDNEEKYENLIDKNGKIIASTKDGEFDEIISEDTKLGYIVVSKTNENYQTKTIKYGLLDLKGKWKEPLSKDNEYLKDIKVVGKGLYILDNHIVNIENNKKSEAEVNGSGYGYVSEDVIIIDSNGKVTFFDKNNLEKLGEIEYTGTLGKYSDGLIFVQNRREDGVKKGFYNKKGEVIIDVDELDITICNTPYFSNGTAALDIKNDANTRYYGVIDKSGKFKFEPVAYDENISSGTYVQNVGDGIFAVRDKKAGYNRYLYYAGNGQYLFDESFDR